MNIKNEILYYFAEGDMKLNVRIRRYTSAHEDDGVLGKCVRQPVLGAHEAPNETTSFVRVLLQVEQNSDHLGNYGFLLPGRRDANQIGNS